MIKLILFCMCMHIMCPLPGDDKTLTPVQAFVTYNTQDSSTQVNGAWAESPDVETVPVPDTQNQSDTTKHKGGQNALARMDKEYFSDDEEYNAKLAQSKQDDSKGSSESNQVDNPGNSGDLPTFRRCHMVVQHVGDNVTEKKVPDNSEGSIDHNYRYDYESTMPTLSRTDTAYMDPISPIASCFPCCCECCSIMRLDNITNNTQYRAVYYSCMCCWIMADQNRPNCCVCVKTDDGSTKCNEYYTVTSFCCCGCYANPKVMQKLYMQLNRRATYNIQTKKGKVSTRYTQQASIRDMNVSEML